MESLGLQMSWLSNTERSEMWLFGIEYADVLNELLLARVENWCEHGRHGGKQAQWFIWTHSRVIYFDPEVRVSCLVWNHWVCRCLEWEIPKEARRGCLALSTQMFWMNYCLLEWRTDANMVDMAANKHSDLFWSMFLQRSRHAGLPALWPLHSTNWHLYANMSTMPF